MNTIQTLSNAVKRFLTSNTTLLNVVQGQAENAVSLETQLDAAILTAANNARVFAERNHDFAANDVAESALIVPATVLDLDAVPYVLVETVNGNPTNVTHYRRFKSVKAVFLCDTDYVRIRPLPIVQRQTQAIRDRRLSLLNSSSSEMEVVISGRSLTIDQVPDEGAPIYIFGNAWMDEYTVDTDTDFLLQNGLDYMMWSTVCELNYMLLKYVARQEGSMAPPERARDIAFESLKIWDSYSIDGSIYNEL